MSYICSIKLIKPINMELYEITIWKWQEELHKGTYQFRNVQEATQYELGLFEGFRLAGKEPTGMGCMRVENEPTHDAVLIPVDKTIDYIIVDENNKWHSMGRFNTEAELEQDLKDVTERLELEGEGEPIELFVFKAPKIERISYMVNG